MTTSKIVIERETLLPCPFCGANAEILTIPEDHPDAGAMFVQCCDSRCMTSSALLYPLMDDVRALLVERWNRRAALTAQPAPVAVPLTDEQDRALCEAHYNDASEEYFSARPQMDSAVNRRIFYAGHRKGWLAMIAAAGDKT